MFQTYIRDKRGAELGCREIGHKQEHRSESADLNGISRLALNNINTVLSLILCMFFLCGSGSAYVAILFYFFSFSIDSGVFVLTSQPKRRLHQHSSASIDRGMSLWAHKYPATILQLTLKRKKKKIYKYLSLYLYHELRLKKASLRADLCLPGTRMFSSPCLSAVCF